MLVCVGSVLVQRSRYSFREAAQNIAVRTGFFRDVVTKALARGVRVLVLPAGFFRTASEREAEVLAAELCTIVAGHDLIVGFGIDVGDAAKEGSKMENHEGSLYPFFGFVIERGELLLGPVRQIGIRTDEVDALTAEKDMDERLARSHVVPGARIALLLCGEVQSTSVRVALAEKSPSLVLHPAHASVQLAGGSKESWRKKIAELLKMLPTATIWAFADHIASGQHLDSECNFASLVRQGGSEEGAREGPYAQVGFNGEAGWLYTYDAVIEESAS